jgi:hypothetical protein
LCIQMIALTSLVFVRIH